jgi:heat shock protein 5
VTLELDADAQLHAEATDRSSGKSERTIIYNKHRKSLEEIFREAEEWQARDELAAYVRGVTDAVDGRMEPEEEEKVEEAVTKAMEWFDVSPAVAVARKEDYAENLRELVKVCDPVVLAVHQRFPGGRDDAEL